MREKDLLSRREFIKTLAVGVGIAGTGTAGLTAVMKAAGFAGGSRFRRRRGANPPIARHQCRMCQKCLPCPQAIPIPRIKRHLFYLRNQGQGRTSPWSYAELAARQKGDRRIQCGICESKCAFAAGGGMGCVLLPH